MGMRILHACLSCMHMRLVCMCIHASHACIMHQYYLVQPVCISRMLPIHTYYASMLCTHFFHERICMHIMHAYHACMHIMHASDVGQKFATTHTRFFWLTLSHVCHVCMHGMYACMICMH